MVFNKCHGLHFWWRLLGWPNRCWPVKLCVQLTAISCNGWINVQQCRLCFGHESRENGRPSSDATSNLARKTELHLMEMDNGVMRMRPIEGGIDLPAGKTIHLAPGGYHVMLIGLNAPSFTPVAYSKSHWSFRMLARKLSKAWQCCHLI